MKKERGVMGKKNHGGEQNKKNLLMENEIEKKLREKIKNQKQQKRRERKKKKRTL